MKKKTHKIVIIAALALAFIAASVFLANGLEAQDTNKNTAAASANSSQAMWLLRCDEIKDGEKVTGKYCEMVQSISVAKKDADPSTAQRLLEVAIGYPPSSEGKATGIMVLPLGVLVTEDVVIEADGNKVKSVPVQYCEVTGCFATFNLSEKEMGKLANGTSMSIKTMSATGQPVLIELSLSGVNDVYGKIKPVKTGGLFD